MSECLSQRRHGIRGCAITVEVHVSFGLPGFTVVGLPDKMRGQSIAAFVVPREVINISTGDLRTHCAKYLSNTQVPQAIHLIKELPRNALGKIQKFRLRTNYEQFLLDKDT